MRALSPQGNVDLDTMPALGDSWRSARMRLNIKKYPTVGASQRGIALDATRYADATAALTRRAASIFAPIALDAVEVYPARRAASGTVARNLAPLALGDAWTLANEEE